VRPVQVTVDRADLQVLVKLGDGLGLRLAVGTNPGYLTALVVTGGPERHSEKP
jgi:hypothetical protein